MDKKQKRREEKRKERKKYVDLKSDSNLSETNSQNELEEKGNLGTENLGYFDEKQLRNISMEAENGLTSGIIPIESILMRKQKMKEKIEEKKPNNVVGLISNESRSKRFGRYTKIKLAECVRLLLFDYEDTNLSTEKPFKPQSTSLFLFNVHFTDLTVEITKSDGFGSMKGKSTSRSHDITIPISSLREGWRSKIADLESEYGPGETVPVKVEKENVIVTVRNHHCHFEIDDKLYRQILMLGEGNDKKIVRWLVFYHHAKKSRWGFLGDPPPFGESKETEQIEFHHNSYQRTDPRAMMEMESQMKLGRTPKQTFIGMTSKFDINSMQSDQIPRNLSQVRNVKKKVVKEAKRKVVSEKFEKMTDLEYVVYQSKRTDGKKFIHNVSFDDGVMKLQVYTLEGMKRGIESSTGHGKHPVFIDHTYNLNGANNNEVQGLALVFMGRNKFIEGDPAEVTSLTLTHELFGEDVERAFLDYQVSTKKKKFKKTFYDQKYFIHDLAKSLQNAVKSIPEAKTIIGRKHFEDFVKKTIDVGKKLHGMSVQEAKRFYVDFTSLNGITSKDSKYFNEQFKLNCKFYGEYATTRVVDEIINRGLVDGCCAALKKKAGVVRENCAHADEMFGERKNGEVKSMCVQYLLSQKKGGDLKFLLESLGQLLQSNDRVFRNACVGIGPLKLKGKYSQNMKSVKRCYEGLDGFEREEYANDVVKELFNFNVEVEQNDTELKELIRILSANGMGHYSDDNLLNLSKNALKVKTTARIIEISDTHVVIVVGGISYDVKKVSGQWRCYGCDEGWKNSSLNQKIYGMLCPESLTVAILKNEVETTAKLYGEMSIRTICRNDPLQRNSGRKRGDSQGSKKVNPHRGFSREPKVPIDLFSPDFEEHLRNFRGDNSDLALISGENSEPPEEVISTSELIALGENEKNFERPVEVSSSSELIADGENEKNSEIPVEVISSSELIADGENEKNFEPPVEVSSSSELIADGENDNSELRLVVSHSRTEVSSSIQMEQDQWVSREFRKEAMSNYLGKRIPTRIATTHVEPCGFCFVDVETENCIMCDHCQIWYHCSCVGVGVIKFVELSDDGEYLCPDCSNDVGLQIKGKRKKNRDDSYPNMDDAPTQKKRKYDKKKRK